MLNSSNPPPQQQHFLQPLRQLLRDHAFVFCGGLWAALVIGGSMAALGLLNPGPLEKDGSQPTPALTTFEESTVKKKLPLPLPLLGTVILGCAAGSLIVTQVLKYSIGRRSSKRSKPSGTVRRKRRYSATRQGIVPTPQPVSSALTYNPSGNQLSKINKQLTQVTVLPPEESHPLDGGDENLADMMDLRKRHSLTSLMRRK